MREDHTFWWDGPMTVVLTCAKCGEKFRADQSDADAPTAICHDCRERAFYARNDDNRDSIGKPCECATKPQQDCPRHGIAASNARQNRYWQRVGGHE